MTKKHTKHYQKPLRQAPAFEPKQWPPPEVCRQPSDCSHLLTHRLEPFPETFHLRVQLLPRVIRRGRVVDFTTPEPVPFVQAGRLCTRCLGTPRCVSDDLNAIIKANMALAETNSESTLTRAKIPFEIF